jgi:predicted nucleic acid-binding protein
MASGVRGLLAPIGPVLIALLVAEDVHHDHASAWLSDFDAGFATCPITERSLVRSAANDE